MSRWVSKALSGRGPGLREPAKSLNVRDPRWAGSVPLTSKNAQRDKPHGTTEPETIGTNVSSGCIRLVNQDVIHLYHRTPEGAKVVVLA